MEKIHSTNYTDTFILVADDCPSRVGEFPPQKDGVKSVANIQFDLIRGFPYKYTSDDIIFLVFANRNNLPLTKYDSSRRELFSKGQACLRSSPLTKRYGWGVHSNHEGKVALYGAETGEYQKFLMDQGIRKVKAMRSSRTSSQ